MATHTAGAASSARGPLIVVSRAITIGKDDHEQSEVGHQRHVDENRADPRHIAVHDHHSRDPIERAREVDDAGDEAEPAGAENALAGDGDQQRSERNPAECGMTELRKADGEEGARKQGEDEGARPIQRVTQGLICSSFCSFAAIVSASRFVLKVPIRTRNTVPVPLGGCST